MLGYAPIGSDPVSSQQDAGTSVIIVVAPGAALVGLSSFTAGAAVGGAGVINANAPGAVLTALASIVAGAASGGVSAQAPGSAMISFATFIGGAAREIFYDSLPAPDSRTIRVEIEVRVVLVPQ